jgi:hypothetical protein
MSKSFQWGFRVSLLVRVKIFIDIKWIYAHSEKLLAPFATYEIKTISFYWKRGSSGFCL